MTPFLQFRLWWRRSTSGERVPAVLATLAVLALAAWVLTPTTSDDDQVSAGPGGFASTDDTATDDLADDDGATSPDDAPAASGQEPSGTSSGTGSSTGSGPRSTGGHGTSAGGDAPAGGGGDDVGAGAERACPPTPQGARGVTDDELLVVFALLDLAGPIGNGAVNQASAAESQRLLETIVADINANGGLACRQVRAKFYRVNPISPNATQAACIDIVEDRPALAVDAGGLVYANAFNCVAQQRVPTMTAMNLLPADVERFAPYLAAPSGDLGTVMTTFPRGLEARGFFDPASGFEKLGLLMDECAPQANEILLSQLTAVGIGKDERSIYRFACPESGFASPADMSQAVVQHRGDGATHVLPITGSGSFNAYAEAAEGQRYRPRYAVTDYQGIIITTASNLKPNADNFDGAVAITTGTFGLDTTPGLTIDAATRRCVAHAEKAGLDPAMVYNGGGTACSMAWTAAAALDNARALSPEAILPGLFEAGAVELSHPLANATFGPPLKFTGGDTWWPIEWHKECTCWKVLDPNRKPSVRP